MTAFNVAVTLQAGSGSYTLFQGKYRSPFSPAEGPTHALPSGASNRKHTGRWQDCHGDPMSRTLRTVFRVLHENLFGTCLHNGKQYERVNEPLSHSAGNLTHKLPEVPLSIFAQVSTCYILSPYDVFMMSSFSQVPSSLRAAVFLLCRAFVNFASVFCLNHNQMCHRLLEH